MMIRQLANTSQRFRSRQVVTMVTRIREGDALIRFTIVTANFGLDSLDY